MSDDLPRCSARRSKAQAVDDIIEPSFEHFNEYFTRTSGLAERLFKIVPELILHQPIGTPYFLFFPQLDAVLRNLRPAELSVLSRRIAAAFDRAFFRETFGPLKEQFLLFSPA